MKKTVREKQASIDIVLFVTVAVMLFVTQIFINNSPGAKMSSFRDDWTINGEQHMSLPADIQYRANDIITMTRRLPHDLREKDAVIFKSENIFWKLYVDGELIRQYTKPPIGMTAGDQWNVVILPEGSEGKELTIETIIPYRFLAQPISDIYIEDHMVASGILVRSMLLPFAIAMYVIGLSLNTIVLNVSLYIPGHSNYTLAWLASFAISLSVWSVVQSPVVKFLFPETYLPTCLLYASIPLTIGFATVYYMQTAQFPMHILNKTLLVFPFTLVVIMPVMDLTCAIPYASTIMICLLLMIHLITMIAFAILRMAKKKTSDKISLKIMVAGNIFMLFMITLDILQSRVWHGDDYLRNTRVALLIYLLTVANDRLSQISEYRQKINEAKAMSKMAYIDGLTGIANRMAFNQKMDILQKSTNIGFASLDVNNLKTVNDRFGHLEGDKLLKTTAKVIKEAFQGVGEVYRYGGDEFIVIIEQFSYEKAAAAAKKLETLSDEVNRKHELQVPFAVACGYAGFDLDDDSSLLVTLQKADDRMYQNKTAIKLRAGGREVVR